MCDECDKKFQDFVNCYGPDSFGGDEYAPEENPFDRFDEEPAPDDLEPSPFVSAVACEDISDADCARFETCKDCPGGSVFEDTEEEEELDEDEELIAERCENGCCWGVCVEEEEFEDEECGGNCPECAAVEKAAADIAKDVEADIFRGIEASLQAAETTKLVFVMVVPGEKVPTVLSYTTDEEKVAAHAYYYSAVTDTGDFTKDVSSAVLNVVELAAISEEDEDVRDAVYALCSVYPFYVVPLDF